MKTCPECGYTEPEEKLVSANVAILLHVQAGVSLQAMVKEAIRIANRLGLPVAFPWAWLPHPYTVYPREDYTQAEKILARLLTDTYTAPKDEP